MRRSAALAVLLSASSALAAAPADSTADRARAQIEKTPGVTSPLKFSGELGSSLTRGNADTFHLVADLRLVWVPAERWVSSTRAKGFYQEATVNDVDLVTGNSWLASERADRFLLDWLSVYAIAAYERDIFTGLRRRLSGQLGVSFLLVDRHDPERENLLTDKLALEAGGYVAEEQFTRSPLAPPGTVVAPDANVIAARAAASYVHAFQKGDEAGIELEAIQDFVDTDNLVTTATAFAAGSLLGGIALKVTVTHKYDNVPSDPSLEKHDLIAGAALVATFEQRTPEEKAAATR